MSDPLVSIILPIYNHVQYTRKCLELLYKNTSPEISFEVIAVNDASTDDTGDYLDTAVSQFGIKVITNPHNLGFSKSCNVAARHCRGKYLLFLNNDTEPQKGWLKAMVQVVEADPKVGAVGCKLLFPDGTIQHAGIVITRDMRLDIEPGITHIYFRQPGDLAEAQEMRVYPALTAASFLVPTHVYKAVGGFDERYYNGSEDIDICFKIRRAGYLLVYQPESVLIHHECVSGKVRFLKTDENFRLSMAEWGEQLMQEADFTRNANTPFILSRSSVVRRYRSPSTPAGHNDPAETKLRKISRMLPLKYIPAGYISYMYFHLGEKYRQNGQHNWKYYYKKALQVLQEKTKRTPNEHYRVASLYKRLGMYKKAERWFLQLNSLPIPPAIEGKMHFHLGEIYLVKKQLKDAKIHLNRCLQLIPGHDKARQLLEKTK